MEKTSKLDRFYTGLTKVLAVIGAILIMIVMFMIITDVVCRWIQKPILGVFELSSMFVGICVYLGIAYIQRNKMHITANILENKGPKWLQVITNLLGPTIGIVICGWFTVLYAQSSWTAYLIDERLIGVMNYPAIYLKVCMTLGMALTCIQFVVDFIREWKKTFCKHSEEVAEL